MPLGPLDMIAGATKRFTLTVADDAGNVIDLTGCTASMMVRTSYGSPALLTLTTENGGLAIDGPNGLIHVLITATQSASLPVSYAPVAASAFSFGDTTATIDPSIVLPFDVKVVFPSGDVTILDDPVNTPFALTVYGAVTR